MENNRFAHPIILHILTLKSVKIYLRYVQKTDFQIQVHPQRFTLDKVYILFENCYFVSVRYVWSHKHVCTTSTLNMPQI